MTNQTYCRLCMCEEHLKIIDESLIGAIRNEFSIEIHKNDDLSREICDQCLQFIEKLIAFKEKIKKVQQLLQKIVKPKNVTCVLNIESDDKDDTNISVAKNTPVSKRSNVIHEENVPVPIDLIRKIIKSIDPTELKCTKTHQLKSDFCDVCFDHISDKKLQNHINSINHIFKSRIVEKTGKTNIFEHFNVAYTCSFCSKIFTTKLGMSEHALKEHNANINRKNIKPDTIVPRNKKKKVDEQQILKEVVIKKEPGIDDLNVIKLETPISGKEYVCKFCHKMFGFIESYRRHLQKHHPDQHLCIKCGFISSNRKTFSAHLREHYNLTYLQRVCSICFKICLNYKELILHRRETHDGGVNVKYKCSICCKTFDCSALVKKHKREVHLNVDSTLTNEKENLLCKRCNRHFLTKLVLKKHQCRAKKFKCVKLCGKRFDSHSIMMRHSSKCNKGTTIYNCKMCHKSLSSLASFKRHITTCRSTKESASVTCSHCKMNFASEHDFEDHYENKHKKIKEEEKVENTKTKSPRISITDRTDKSVDNSNTSLLKTPDFSFNKSNFLIFSAKKSLICKYCNKSFSTLKDLDDHFTKCSRNSAKSKRKQKMKKIVKKMDIKLNKTKNEKVKECRFCGSIFYNDYFFKKHKEMHSNSKPVAHHSSSRFNSREIISSPAQNHLNKTPSGNNLAITIVPTVKNAVCTVCKKSDVHLFCNPCNRCFVRNHVQYMNHMKMKHS